jgi:hypothetical protein
VLALAPRDRQALEHEEYVLFDRQLAEDRRLLRQVTYPVPRPEIHGEAGNLFGIEENLPPVGPLKTYDHVKDGGLARAVRAEEPDDLALAYVERHAVDDRALAVGFLQPLDTEHARFLYWYFRADVGLGLAGAIG